MFVCMSCLRLKHNKQCDCPDPDPRKVELTGSLTDKQYCYECEVFVCKCGCECACDPA